MGMTLEGIALTPRLFLTDRDSGDAETIRKGGRAYVSSKERAREILTELGASEAAIRRALVQARGPSEVAVSRAKFEVDSSVEKSIDAVLKHLDGQHDQKKHGRRRDVTRSKQLARKMSRYGGYTYQPVANTWPDEGFAVSVLPEAEVMTFGRPTRSNLANFVRKHKAKAAERDNLHLGGWYDTKTGRGYLDLSVVVDSKEEATRLAKEHDQIAFIDLKTFDEYDQDGRPRGVTDDVGKHLEGEHDQQSHGNRDYPLDTDARRLTKVDNSVEFTGVQTEEGKWGKGTWYTQGRGQFEGNDVVVPVVNPDGFSSTLRLSMFERITIVAENVPY